MQENAESDNMPFDLELQEAPEIPDATPRTARRGSASTVRTGKLSGETGESQVLSYLRITTTARFFRARCSSPWQARTEGGTDLKK